MNKISTWIKKKERLKQKIFLSELSNDSYYLSPFYKEHQKELIEIERKIKEIQDEQIRNRCQEIS